MTTVSGSGGSDVFTVETPLPAAITGLFQGLLLFYLLAADLFITFRLKRVVPVESNVIKPTAPAAPAESAA